MAGGKRGSHLSLSVERLCALAGSPVTRIGLSATQRPIEKVARFLVGNENLDSDGRPLCEIVDIGYGREMDLGVEIPGGELGPVATNILWDETVARVAELSAAHRTTPVFMNTRRLVERVAHQLSGLMGEDKVAPHHGSLSRQTRLRVERQLKQGELKVCVATASLELGIDIGAIDLVCQIGTPRSIGILPQRVGRSGHWLGGVTKGRLFPAGCEVMNRPAWTAFALQGRWSGDAGLEWQRSPRSRRAAPGSLAPRFSALPCGEISAGSSIRLLRMNLPSRSRQEAS